MTRTIIVQYCIKVDFGLVIPRDYRFFPFSSFFFADEEEFLFVG